jgi:hypothetical protein
MKTLSSSLSGRAKGTSQSHLHIRFLSSIIEKSPERVVVGFEVLKTLLCIFIVAINNGQRSSLVRIARVFVTP